ncbi:MAG: FAD-binding dehydrogenase [Acidimicrobiales bacterium]|nr:FAD-binding dehydrogenase [Acidimicrobiales bacterium]MYG61191.1 FAD-binding dehydrogenase [Acidimicrobiales bacterium]MYJ46313.1 FAD-binding dehydrogenase [Acidimicrobiales bacterium]
MCAALAAHEGGARVLVLERAPEAEAGGNSRFTAGAIRFAYDGVDDLRALMPDLTDAEVEMTDFGTYTEEQFYADLCRISDYRCDPDLADMLVTRSKDTLMWMASHGVRFAPIWGRQAFKVDGRFTFWGGLTVESVGGGEGLVESLRAALNRNQIDLWHEAAARSLLTDDSGAVRGVRARCSARVIDVECSAVVLAAGGFQANAEWRTRYLGPGWDLAKVRGTRFNTGDGIAMALDIGAMPYGNWSGAHAVAWDYNAPEFGDLAVGDGFQKHSYPFSIVLNQDGQRFVDEGADFRNYTYARYGREILAQPGHSAWQVFDASTDHLLRDEYRIRQVTKVTADSIEELCARMEDVHTERALATISEFNAAVDRSVGFDPNVLDGRRTRGLSPDKTNWAMPIETPPFTAFRVTCGLTFTFGGLRVDETGCVIDTDLRPIKGLYAAGELVGGLFYGNYPGGSGLSAGAVFGRLAGGSAAEHATG